MAEDEPSYIDYEAFLDPDFSPASFANSLVLATNNATDTPLDLSTPLSRVLFDLQEIDTHIHNVTTKSALPLLTHTRDQTAAAERILKETEQQISSVTKGYERLEQEVLRKWENADEARVAAENSLATVRLARAVARCLALGRQLEGQLAEVTGRNGTATAATQGLDNAGSPIPGREDYRALERAASTIVNLRRMFSATAAGEEGYGLDRVRVIRTLRGELVIPAENMIKARAQQTINRFSMSSIAAGSHSQAGYRQARDARARLVSAVITLYILSPVPKSLSSPAEFNPELLLSTLQGYMHTAIVTSLNSLSRSLSMLPSLERTLNELSGRCQDIFALEAILSNLRPPAHPLLPVLGPSTNNGSMQDRASEITSKNNLLQPLLNALDTSSLPSYFWRSLASSLAPRVQEILNRGGVSARTLRSNRDRLKRDIRECVLRGSHLPAATSVTEKRTGAEAGNWEREAAVMVGSVMNALDR
ncbi:Golgi transport complex subunit COG5 [Aspergillus clavatus NRRL 1]|uniref:Conserved oligomeric Golgi complex subunit 5 n=1 Tax=Aspergillus clavatus (strain ATCC 1007 / CBS 513.65 / DSM 816 / NCTC 3887 / NRRL 1 / QM 1276 / 107) TaxID=344612 RepID=A1CK80_ASPCL|nr:Golgi transport complex component Cog5, putative [Aspergillus clavatus NRRL 1]EAW09554.1 Golgi transport complex component Cog5, putaitve [Aspergillus clavatus NRRL 1]